MMPILRSAKEQYEASEKYTDAIRLAGAIMVGGGLGPAAELATAKGWTRVADVLHKATISATTTGANSITTLLGAFMQAVRNIGVVDTIAANAMRLPDRFVGRVTVFSNIAASSVGEGAAKTLKYLSLTMSDFAPVKAIAQVVLSDETILSLGDEGLRILGQELKNSVATGSDSAFLGALTGESGEAQGGDSWQGINDDIEELLRDLRLGAGSKPFLITTPAIAKSLAIEGLVNGVDTLRWNGGTYAGIEILVSDAQTAGRITAVDATGLVILLGDLELRSSGQALVEMVDTSSQSSVTGTGVSAVSMFQTNSKALLAERALAVKAIRAASYAHLTGVQLGGSFDSPANP